MQYIQSRQTRKLQLASIGWDSTDEHEQKLSALKVGKSSSYRPTDFRNNLLTLQIGLEIFDMIEIMDT
jgi:hypothetical protein